LLLRYHGFIFTSLILTNNNVFVTKYSFVHFLPKWNVVLFRKIQFFKNNNIFYIILKSFEIDQTLYFREHNSKNINLRDINLKLHKLIHI
jgi:hypothetical protein